MKIKYEYFNYMKKKKICMKKKIMYKKKVYIKKNCVNQLKYFFYLFEK